MVLGVAVLAAVGVMSIAWLSVTAGGSYVTKAAREQQLQTLQDRIEGAQSDAEALTDKLTALRSQHTSLLADVRDLTQKQAALAQEKKNAEDVIGRGNEAEQELRQRRALLQDLQARLNDLITDIASKEQERLLRPVTPRSRKGLPPRR